MSIKQLPESERPYEKLQIYGPEKLSEAELVSIIIKTGNKNLTSVQLATEILKLGNKKNSLRSVFDCSIEEFMQINGIGKVKAMQLVAIGELAKRMSKPISILNLKISSPKDIYNLLVDELKYEKRELVKVVILNIKNIILKITDISYGGTNFAYIDPKDVLKEAIKINAPKIMLIHNHPSGNPSASKQDILLTQKIYDCAKIFGIQLIDHIIISDGGFESIFSKGYVKT